MVSLTRRFADRYPISVSTGAILGSKLGENRLEAAEYQRFRIRDTRERDPATPVSEAPRGTQSAASVHRAAMTRKPRRPSPGSENESPTSGVPTRIVAAAAMLTSPTAAPGASGRRRAASVKAAANGSPAARPTTAAARIATAICEPA